MQSSRRASLLRRSAAACTCIVALLSPTGESTASGPPPSTPNVSGAPLAEDDLAPLGAFAERVILLVRTPGDDGLMARLLAELRESDWHVLEMRPDERFAPTRLGVLAERERASAAVRLDARRDLVELWVQRPDGPVEETIAAPGGPDEQVLALRVTEALRARGLLVAHPEPRADAEPSPRTSEPRAAPPPPSAEKPQAALDDRVSLALEAGPALALSPGGLGPLPLLEGDVRLEFAGRWSLCLLGFLPLAHQSLAATEGEAEVKTAFVGGILELEWARLSFGGFRSGIGASAAITTMSGVAEDPGFASEEDIVTTLAPLVRSSFHLTLGRAFRIRSAVVVGATVPEVRVAFGSRSVATWGEPFVVMSLALETNPFHW